MTIYRERLWASAWLFLAVALVIPATLLVFLPINRLAGVIVAILLFAGCVAALLAASSPVVVTTEAFTAGVARLPIEHVGRAEGFTGSEAVLQRGQRLDSRAWLLIRGWIGPVVAVEVVDEGDPTPYWLVSTRHPDRLVAALEEAKRRTPDR